MLPFTYVAKNLIGNHLGLIEPYTHAETLNSGKVYVEALYIRKRLIQAIFYRCKRYFTLSSINLQPFLAAIPETAVANLKSFAAVYTISTSI